MTTAFVLSGGASLGAVQVGMLQSLAERGVEPDLVVGTSVGALNAAWVASHPEPERLYDLATLWRTMRFDHLFPVRPAGAIRGLLARRNYLVDSKNLADLLAAQLPVTRIERTPTPLHVVATELLTGRERVLSQGPLVPALVASSSIPGVYPPVRLAGCDLVDGGLSANTPISHAVDLGAETVYVLPTGYACALPEPPAGIVGMALHSLTILLQRQLIYDVERNQQRAEIIVLPPLCPLDVSPTDFGHSADLIARARSATDAWLRSGRRPRDSAKLLAFHGRHRTARRLA